MGPVLFLILWGYNTAGDYKTYPSMATSLRMTHLSPGSFFSEVQSFPFRSVGSVVMSIVRVDIMYAYTQGGL